MSLKYEPSSEPQLIRDLKAAVETYHDPVFTTALIAGDDVILHVMHKAGLLDKIKVMKCAAVPRRSYLRLIDFFIAEL